MHPHALDTTRPFMTTMGARLLLASLFAAGFLAISTPVSAQERSRGSVIESVKKKLDAAVKAGKLTRQEADRRLASIRKDMERRKTAKRRRAEAEKKLAAIKDELESAVRDGKMTRAMAKARLALARMKLNADRFKKRSPHDPAAITREAAGIKAAVAKGEMKEADGRAKLAVIEKKKALNAEHAKHVDALLKSIATIDADLSAGKITPEEAEKKLKKIRERSRSAKR